MGALDPKKELTLPVTVQAVTVMDTAVSIGAKALLMITGLRLMADPTDPRRTLLKIWQPLSPDLPRLVDLVRGDGDATGEVEVRLDSRTRANLRIVMTARYLTHGVETDLAASTASADPASPKKGPWPYSDIYLDSVTLVASESPDVQIAHREELPTP